MIDVAGEAALVLVERLGAIDVRDREHDRLEREEQRTLGIRDVAVGENGRLIQIYAQRQIAGVPVRNSYVQGVVNSGNLVLFGSRNWGKIDVSTQPSLSAADASTAVEKYVESSGKVSGIAGWWREPHLTLVPTAPGEKAPPLEMKEVA